MSPRWRDINKRPGGSDISEYPGRSALRILCLALLAAAAFPAAAYTVTINAASPKTVYLQVGVGSFNGIYDSGGTPATNTTVNKVSVSVAANAVGNGTAQAMTTDSTQSNSFYDNYAFCNVPQQLYIGGFYRTTGNGNGSVNVTATVPAALVDSDRRPAPLLAASPGPPGATAHGHDPRAALHRRHLHRRWGADRRLDRAEPVGRELLDLLLQQHHVVPAGTYTGRVLYTLTAP